jgi:hypothetical protein
MKNSVQNIRNTLKNTVKIFIQLNIYYFRQPYFFLFSKYFVNYEKWGQFDIHLALFLNLELS